MDIKEDKPQDELEKKISEAELKAQEQEAKEAEDSNVSFEGVTEEVGEEPLPEKKGLSRARKIWRRILIWLVVIAIAFAGGFFVDTVLRLQPEQDRVAALQQDIHDAQEEITSLQAEIEVLDTFQEKNIALNKEIDDLEIHLIILSLRTGVAEASLALEQGRQADAKLALDKVGSSLETLQGMLNEDQGEVVDNMIQRYQLVMIELENDGATVLTDLELLSSKLLTLENTLFATP
jgi:flagellin-specific chaperone FliS